MNRGTVCWPPARSDGLFVGPAGAMAVSKGRVVRDCCLIKDECKEAGEGARVKRKDTVTTYTSQVIVKASFVQVSWRKRKEKEKRPVTYRVFWRSHYCAV